MSTTKGSGGASTPIGRVSIAVGANTAQMLPDITQGIRDIELASGKLPKVSLSFTPNTAKLVPEISSAIRAITNEIPAISLRITPPPRVKIPEPDTSGFDNAVTRSFSKFKEHAASLLQYTAVAFGIREATSVIIDGTKGYITELQQAQQAQELFGASGAKVVNDLADQAVTKLGQTRGEALTTINDLGRMYESVGAKPLEAAQQAATMTQRIADLASATGKTNEQVNTIIDTAVRGGARGLIALHELGVGIDQNALKAQAVKDGYITAGDPVKIAANAASIKKVQDEIAASDPSSPAKSAAKSQGLLALQIAQTNYDKQLKLHGATGVATASALHSLTSAQTAYAKASETTPLQADRIATLNAQLAKLQAEQDKLVGGAADIADPNIKRLVLDQLIIQGSAAVAGHHGKGPQDVIVDLGAAARQAQDDIGKGLYPQLEKLGVWASTHGADIQAASKSIGDFVGTAATVMGNIVSLIAANWGVIKLFLEAFAVAFAADKFLGFLGGFQTFIKALSGMQGIESKLFPNLSKTIGKFTGAEAEKAAVIDVAADVVNVGGAGTAGVGKTVQTEEQRAAQQLENEQILASRGTGKVASSGATMSPEMQAIYNKAAGVTTATAVEGEAAVIEAKAASTKAGMIAAIQDSAVVGAMGGMASKGFAMGMNLAGGAALALPLIAAFSSYIESKGGIGLSPQNVGDAFKTITSGITGNYGGSTPAEQLNLTAQNVTQSRVPGEGDQARRDRGIKVLTDALGSPGLQNIVTSGDSTGLGNLAALAKSLGDPKLSQEYSSLASLTEQGLIKDPMQMRIFLNNMSDYTTAYAALAAQARTDVANAQMLLNRIAPAASTPASLGPVAAPPTISTLDGGSTGGFTAPPIVANPGLYGSLFPSTSRGTVTSHAAGTWLSRPAVIEAGHGPSGEGVFTPEQVSALHSMGIKAGQSMGGAGQTVNVYNPTSDVDVMMALRRQQHLDAYAERGITPAAWPSSMRG